MAEVQIAKLMPKHEEIMNQLLANPTMKRGKLALAMGVTESWLSVIINSDVFQAKLRERQDEINSISTEKITSKITRLAELALDRMIDLAPLERDMDNLNKAAKTALESLGYGRGQPQVPLGAGGVTNNFIGVTPELLSEARNRILRRHPAEDAQVIHEARDVPSLDAPAGL